MSKIKFPTMLRKMWSGTEVQDWLDANVPDGTEALAEMETRKDAAYLERNQVVAALAKAFPSGVARTAIEGWSEDWHGCVYIDLPTGQASWHFHDSQDYLFEGLPAYTGKWDGHTTEEKYARLAALSAPAPQVLPTLEWAEAPVETQWGSGMMVASVELSKDETADIFAHKSALHLVSAALQGAALSIQPPAPRRVDYTELAMDCGGILHTGGGFSFTAAAWGKFAHCLHLPSAPSTEGAAG